ncbi:NB-ARC domain-containing protein [Micromonospora sp. R77]|uniref:NB-ARC domain-containing protein n=1 Tax=Micromonospora sp. R77 TaxID=2925836 RepID=UPI001F62339C|nr:NB-ARC domain-containing protein [Micromonospora sp. R77]MCI4061086.1 NB-ARC domain-containing protein [Micromonospora sp. R77]
MITNLTGLAINILSSGEGKLPFGLESLRDHAVEWTVGLTLAMGALALVMWRRQGDSSPQQSDPPPPTLQEPPGWVVKRPAEVDHVVHGLIRGDGQAVGITTALQGAGGFGKTTLATVVCADPRIRRRFRGRVYQVTLGRDLVSPEAIASRVNDTIRIITGEDTNYSDPRLAGQHLGRLLHDRPRMLLLVDDVWNRDQVSPFLLGGPRCARLVTTRVSSALPGDATTIKVDQMSPEQARQVLVWSLPSLPHQTVEQLLAATGRWPLLLRLVNRVIANAVEENRDPARTAADILRLLSEGGPAEIDGLTDSWQELDLNIPEQRARAVRATIEASTKLLDNGGDQRLAELGIFVEDESIPIRAIAVLWERTSSLTRTESETLCRRMVQLALVRHASTDGTSFAIHDVVRDFLRAELGADKLEALNKTLVEAVAQRLPRVAAAAADSSSRIRIAWWELKREDRYLWDHLITHLVAAGRADEGEELAGNLVWAGQRLMRFGPAAPYSDLAAFDTPGSRLLRADLGRASHLLAPTDPPEAVIHILHSRLRDRSSWQAQVKQLDSVTVGPRLIHRWAMPDLPHPAMRRNLVDHDGAVLAVAMASDGAWLATSGEDAKVRLWDSATGQIRATLDGHTGPVRLIRLSADDKRVVTASGDDVRIWEASSGRMLMRLPVQGGVVNDLALAADGTWVVTAGSDPAARIWDTVSGRLIRKLPGHASTVTAVTMPPDNSWIATSSGCTVRIWDASTGQLSATCTGHRGEVTLLSASPDGRWLASAGKDEAARVWSSSDGSPLAVLHSGSGWLSAIAFGADSSWVATASKAFVHLWRLHTPDKPVVLDTSAGHVVGLRSSPTSRWLASAGSDATIRLWNTRSGRSIATLGGHADRLTALRVAPDASWLVSTSRDGTVRTWDVEAASEQVTRTGDNRLAHISAAADGSWIVATGGGDGARVWKVSDARKLRVIHHDPLKKVGSGAESTLNAIGVTGGFLATFGNDERIRIWDPFVESDVHELRLDENERAGRRVKAIASDPSGPWLVAHDSENNLRAWNLEHQQQIDGRILDKALTFKIGADRTAALAVRQGTLLIGEANGSVRTWELETDSVRWSTVGTGPVTAVEFLPEQGIIVTSSNAAAVVIWREGQPKPVTELATDGKVTGLVATLDCHHLVVTTARGSMEVFAVESWRRVTVMRIDGDLTCCTRIPGSNLIAVGGLRGLYMFELRTD